jgi:hypothetical protein
MFVRWIDQMIGSEKFVAEDGKKYMKMTEDWGSKTFMATKSSAPPKWHAPWNSS